MTKKNLLFSDKKKLREGCKKDFVFSNENLNFKRNWIFILADICLLYWSNILSRISLKNEKQERNVTFLAKSVPVLNKKSK